MIFADFHIYRKEVIDMSKAAVLTPDQAKENQRKAKADYLKSKGKMNFAFDEDLILYFKELAKYKDTSLADLVKSQLIECGDQIALSRGETPEEFRKFLDKTFKETIVRETNARRK